MIKKLAKYKFPRTQDWRWFVLGKSCCVLQGLKGRNRMQELAVAEAVAGLVSFSSACARKCRTLGRGDTR